MKRFLTASLAAVLVAFAAARVAAYVRLIHPSSRVALRWADPSGIGIVIHATGPSGVDGSHETALRLAIDDWNAVTGTAASLHEDSSAESRARTDWSAGDVHLVYFDRDNSTGFFPDGSSTLALTPILFSSSGTILDADVLFNGAHPFTTSQEPGAFDIGDIAAHELGHVLGLDHTGFAGGTMFPFVDEAMILHRSLSADETIGLRDAYPSGAHGRIAGNVARASDGSPVSGAYVVARDAGGRTAAAILSQSDGTFELPGLEPGTYTVYARPLDTPVSAFNLGSGYRGGIETDFEPAIHPSTATLRTTETIALGELRVGADVALALGTAADRFPLHVVEGETRTLTLHGIDLSSGSLLAASDPDLVLGDPTWSGTMVSVPVTVPQGEPRGHVDLMVTSPEGRISILPGGLEVTPPSPTVVSVVPARAPASGGTEITLTGSEFHPGARVVIGGRIYADGVDAAVLDSFTITLTIASMPSGVHDVVVIDSSGVEGRLADGFAAGPDVHNVFPQGGAAGGGTEVVLAGNGFRPGLVVRLDGTDQGTVRVESPTLARFTTRGGAPGGPFTCEVETPDGALTELSRAFRYVSQPDPVLSRVTPRAGSTSGGEPIEVIGSGFTAATRVLFGADPETGEGGIDAQSVTFVDASKLLARTPPHPAGIASVLVCDGATAQGALLPGAFTFSASDGGGGGGCHTLPAPPPTAREVLAGAWWSVALVAVLLFRAQRRAPRTVPARA
jgi:hypothetical protein